jgi:CheY-like chemotaxis protein
MMPRIRLIHWRKSEAAAHFEALAAGGYQVEHDEQFRPDLMKQWRQLPPDAFVIDLSRLPSHGREIAIALRQSPSTRSVPIIFCAGEPEKVAAVRLLLPDASYCDVKKLRSTVKKALSSPLHNPLRPKAMMDRYKSRTAAEKLGITAGSSVALISPPRDVERVLGRLPEDVRQVETEAGDPAAQVHLCFVHRPDQLARELSQLRRIARCSKLWVLWRKGGKAAAGDVTENLVRCHALQLGLVDYKICSVNDVWSGMCFALKV